MNPYQTRREITRPDIAVCYGTRPQVVKVARLAPALRERWSVLTIDTGQHYDYALNQGLYDDLGVSPPAVLLGVGAAHPVEQTARIAAGCTQILMTRRPKAVVVVGDTNSTLGCAIAARQVGLPLVHVEAGLRSGVMEMAEERNRVAVDAISQLLCAPSRAAVNHLHSEGVEGSIVLTGDVSRDVLESASRIAPPREKVDEIPTGEFALLTLHRAELTDDRETLKAVLESLATLPLQLLLPLHPRTRRRLEEFKLLNIVPENVKITEPLGYLANITAMRHARVIVTDSGGVQREAYWLGTPCVTLRNETEWTETLEEGANRLVAPSSAKAELRQAFDMGLSQGREWDRNAYGDGNAATAICDAVESLVSRSVTSQRQRVAT